MVIQERSSEKLSARSGTNCPDIDAAISAYREAIRLRPEFLPAHRQLAQALRGKGDVQGAIAECREILRLSPSDAEARGMLAELGGDQAGTLLNRARQLAAQGDFDAAARDCRAAIALQPENAEAHFLLGNALSQISGKTKIEEHAATTISEPIVCPTPPPVPTIQTNPSLIAEDEDTRTQEASALQSASGYRAALRKGNALSVRGNHADAVASLRRAAAIRPNSPEAHNSLGEALRRNCDYSEAAAAFREALRLDCELASAWYNLACASAKLGNVKQAAEALRRAVTLDSKYRELGRTEPALHKIRNATEIAACLAPVVKAPSPLIRPARLAKPRIRGLGRS